MNDKDMIKRLRAKNAELKAMWEELEEWLNEDDNSIVVKTSQFGIRNERVKFGVSTSFIIEKMLELESKKEAGK